MQERIVEKWIVEFRLRSLYNPDDESESSFWDPWLWRHTNGGISVWQTPRHVNGYIPVVERESQNGCCASNSPLAPGRPTNRGGTPIPCVRPSSLCVPVGWVDCTLPGGIDSMLIQIVFGTEGWQSCGNFRTINRVLDAIGPIDRDDPIKRSLDLLITWEEPSDLLIPPTLDLPWLYV